MTYQQKLPLFLQYPTVKSGVLFFVIFVLVSEVVFSLLGQPGQCHADTVKQQEAEEKISAYKKKIFTGLQGAFDTLDTMYNQRFVDMSVGQDATINKTPVYYDGVKALWEFYELTHDTSDLTVQERALREQIPSYIDKAKKIIAQRYIQAPWGGGGYQAFPHGLAYLYQSTSDNEAYLGLKDLRNESNWMSMLNPSRESTGYSRDVAYTLQVGIIAEKMKIPLSVSLTNAELIKGNLEYALSHLRQWHSGVFYDEEFSSRSSFMTGLTMHALIEYYERIFPDPRIPGAVKDILDDLWREVWHDDVTNPSPETLGDGSSYAGMEPGGAFWVYADWVENMYVIDRNHYPSSQDVATTHNLIIGPAYAWYATISGDEEYVLRAVKIFEGVIANLSMYNVNGQMWEGMRYDYDLIRWYRQFYATTCSNSTIEQCSSESLCRNAGGNWTGERCQHAPVTHTSPSRPYVVAPGNLRVID